MTYTSVRGLYPSWTIPTPRTNSVRTELCGWAVPVGRVGRLSRVRLPWSMAGTAVSLCPTTLSAELDGGCHSCPAPVWRWVTAVPAALRRVLGSRCVGWTATVGGVPS